MRSISRKVIEEKLQVLNSEKKRAQEAISKQYKNIRDLETVQYKIEGAIFTLNQLLNK